MPSTTTETLSLVEERKVSVAPLVLLSVVDHYNRGASTSSKNKRVVGVLLGQNDGKVVRVSNSFAGKSRRPGDSVLEHLRSDTTFTQSLSRRTRRTHPCGS